MSIATKSRLVSLVERVATTTVNRVDRDAGIIHGVKVLGRESENGRTYSDAALQDAVRLYEGCCVNLHHPDRGNPRAERRLEEFFGELRNVRLKPDGVYADLHYLRSHTQAAPITEAAERTPYHLGLSHNADGQTETRAGKLIVTRLLKVRSVDLVRNPATSRGLFESVTMRRDYATAVAEALVESDASKAERAKAFAKSIRSL